MSLKHSAQLKNEIQQITNSNASEQNFGFDHKKGSINNTDENDSSKNVKDGHKNNDTIRADSDHRKTSDSIFSISPNPKSHFFFE